MWQIELPSDAKPIGYQALIDLYATTTTHHYRASYASSKWEKYQVRLEDSHQVIYIYPPSYMIQDPFDHIEFALNPNFSNR